MPCSMFSLVGWKIPGADDTPNGKRLYWYRPLCVYRWLYIVLTLHLTATAGMLGTCAVL